MFAEQQVSDRQERLDRVADLVRQRVDAREVQDVVAFVAAFYARMPREDVLDYTAESLYGAALAMYRFAAQHACGTSRVRVYNPRAEEHGWKATHTIVELVNDDMPFLVDSVTAELARREIGLHVLIHPVLKVERDAKGRLRKHPHHSHTPSHPHSTPHTPIPPPRPHPHPQGGIEGL